MQSGPSPIWTAKQVRTQARRLDELAYALGIQVNPNREQLRAKKAHCGRVRDTARKLTSKPALPLTRIVIRQYRCRAGAPPSAESDTQPHADPRITENIANVSSFRSVLGHNPELLANSPVTYRRATSLSGLASCSFQECVPRRGNSHSK